MTDSYEKDCQATQDDVRKQSRRAGIFIDQFTETLTPEQLAFINEHGYFPPPERSTKQ